MKRHSLTRTIRLSSWATAAVVAVIVLALSYDAWDGTKKLEASIEAEAGIRLLHKLEAELYSLRVNELEYFVNLHNDASRNIALGKWSSQEQQFHETMREVLSALDMNDTETRKMNDLNQAVGEYTESFHAITADVASHENEVTLDDLTAFEARLADPQGRMDRATRELEQTIENKVGWAETTARQLERELLLSSIISLVLGLVTIVILLFAAFYVPMQLKNSIQWLSETIEQVSLGKQLSKVSEGPVEEFVPMARSIERLRITVNGMMERYFRTE